MVAPKLCVCPCSAVHPYCCKALSSMILRLRFEQHKLPLFPRPLFLYLQSSEWKQSENAKYRVITKWRLEPKHHLPLFHQLRHLANGSRHDTCVCVCVCAFVAVLYMIFAFSEWRANRDALLQLWAQSWSVSFIRLSGWVPPWEWIFFFNLHFVFSVYCGEEQTVTFSLSFSLSLTS